MNSRKLFLTLLVITAVAADEINLQVPLEGSEISQKFNNFIGRRRIIGGGNVTDDKTWNFVLELTSYVSGSFFTCTGSLIKENYGLSARDCVM